MSLYGINPNDADAVRTAYAEIERVGPRQALRNRLARMREGEAAARARQREDNEADRAERQRQEQLREAVRRVSSSHKRRAIIREVLDVHPGVTLADLLGPSRLQQIVDVRQLVMFRLNRELGLSLPVIGRMFNRDHTTVLHAVRKLAGRAT